ncbi:TonB-dependent receptor family protein [Halioxenophilus aromaticivorans]|uniref:TonB-dependent receptor n=1 Tax=Halioxenophilus aromaticivorans TaxID=1306992 RepID=A0AAV3U807_9ALTE
MNIQPNKHLLSLAIAASIVANQAVAEEDEQSSTAMEEVLVTGGKEAINTLAGSAHLLDEEMLEQFDFSDLNQVLATLPGVYIRQEDGFGLRPNIGLRGVTSERSQKITLMEDGVLIKPAPYSAPAAYYIPNISRMSAVEVVKGPAAIKNGPNNVGGAINLVTQPVPQTSEGFIDLSAGEYGYQKYQVFYGNKHGNFGYWVDALQYGSDGFKELDGGGDTGFTRNDINAKLQWSLDDLWGFEQLITLKVGYADEDADETYLGLTQADFDDNPLRRYAATQLAHFESEHTQIHFDHGLTVSDNLTLNTKLYFNEFERAWRKVDGFISGVPIATVLERPDLFPRELGIIRGTLDTVNTPNETLDITTNDREYGSSGIQLKMDYAFTTGDINHQLEVGVRYHHDYIERDHSTEGYLMQAGNLVNDGLDWGNKTLNKAETDALAVYVHDTLEWNLWTFNAGLRIEDIRSEATDYLNQTQDEITQSVVAPGLGAFWQFSESLGFLVGVNKGFSPAGATAGDDADPEEALNLEYGLRYTAANLSGEVIGFFSDYKNLLGRCRASDTGCNVGEEFNGGGVQVSGVEIYGQYDVALAQSLEMPIALSYTYTESAFQDAFESSFSQWGNVSEGDELPYLPEHTGRLQVGLKGLKWDAFVAVNHQSEMRNQAGSAAISQGLHTDAYTTVDVSGSWNPTPAWLLQLSIDNATDEEAVVSWRPFGARPLKPRTARARVRYSF